MTIIVGQAYLSDYGMTREHVYLAGVAAHVCRSPAEPYRLSITRADTHGLGTAFLSINHTTQRRRKQRSSARAVGRL